MSRLIAPTPKLDKKSSIRFLKEVSENLKRKSYPIPTPKINNVIRSIMFDARLCQKSKEKILRLNNSKDDRCFLTKKQ